MSWNVKDCSERFETLATRIFRERRPPLLLRQIAGSRSLLGQMAKWFQWLIHDSCYDSRIFDSALKTAFGEYRRIFGATREDPPGPRRSGPRFGVVTTSISRDTNTFVVGNFNASQDAEGEPGKLDILCRFYAISLISRWSVLDYQVIRPVDIRNEPTVWRAWVESC